MSCDCRQVKHSLFGPHYKKCRICRNNMCATCSFNKICRVCQLKETTIFEREELIKLPIEKLVEIGEAFNMTIDSDKLLKSQLISLLLISCKSPRKSPQTPKSSPDQTLSPFKTTSTENLMEFPSQLPSSYTEKYKIAITSPMMLKSFSIGHETLTQKPVKDLLPIMKTMNMKSDEKSSGKHEIVHKNQSVGNITMTENKREQPRQSMSMCIPDRESLGEKHFGIMESPGIMHTSTRNYGDRLPNQHLKEITKDTSNKLKSDTNNSTCNSELVGQNETLPIDDERNVESTIDILSSIQNSNAMKIMSKKTPHSRIKLNEISSSEIINDLTVAQLQNILKDHKIGITGVEEKWELAYKVLHLWHDFKKKDGYQPEILFENASLRVVEMGSPATEHKKNYIKTTKRRGIYISENDSCKKQENNDVSKSTETRCELQEDDCFSSKKKKL